MNIQALKGTLFFLAITIFSFSASAQVPKKLIDPANMDLTVKPGDDFYMYASGTWIKNNPVPSKETRWGSFNMLRDFNIHAVKGLVEDASEDRTAAAGSVKRRVGDFYKAAMDTIAIEKLGFSQLRPTWRKLKNLVAYKQFWTMLVICVYLGSQRLCMGLALGRIEKM